jgi:hypothetical protein
VIVEGKIGQPQRRAPRRAQPVRRNRRSLPRIEFGRQVTANFHADLLFFYLRLAPRFFRGSFHGVLPSDGLLPNSMRAQRRTGLGPPVPLSS